MTFFFCIIWLPWLQLMINISGSFSFFFIVNLLILAATNLSSWITIFTFFKWIFSIPLNFFWYYPWMLKSYLLFWPPYVFFNIHLLLILKPLPQNSARFPITVILELMRFSRRIIHITSSYFKFQLLKDYWWQWSYHYNY